MAVSSELSSQGSSRKSGTHRGMAFLIEALVVLAFLMTSLAVFVQLFSAAQLEGMRANRLSKAVLLATNTAEEFSADPTRVEEQFSKDGLTVTCKVDETKRSAGTLLDATITVSEGDTEVYVLHTARYANDAEGGAR